MNKRKIYYLLHSGKNSKLAYYIKVYLQEITPRCLLRPFLSHLLQEAEKRSDYDYIMERVNYYNRLTKDIVFSQDDWQKEAVCLDKQQKTGQKVYYFDAMEYGRWFPGHLLWRL